MNIKSVIPQQINSFDYYVNKLPLYLQNSYGIVEQFRIWYDLFSEGVGKRSTLMLNLLNIFDADYLTYLNSLKSVELDSSIAIDGIKFDTELYANNVMQFMEQVFSYQNSSHAVTNTNRVKIFRFLKDSNNAQHLEFTKRIYSDETFYTVTWYEGNNSYIIFSIDLDTQTGRVLRVNNNWTNLDQFGCRFFDELTITDIDDETKNMLWLFDINLLNTSINSDILDKLAELFCVARQFNVTYVDNEQVSHTEELTLSDAELLLLIKVEIIRSHYDGSRESLIDLYSSLGLLILYATSSSGDCDVYLCTTSGSTTAYTDNIKKMFWAGMLHIQSLGINYSFTIISIENVLIWDKAVDANYTGWDGGIWAL